MKKNKVIINIEKCKGCSLCIEECSANILVISNETINTSGYHPATVTDQSKCTGCLKCAINCPEAIITVIREEG